MLKQKVKEDSKLHLKLKGKTEVYIDWANVYGWRESLGREVVPGKLYNYLKLYGEIKKASFYFGTDKHPKSRQFLSRVKRIGYRVVTKSVKYILVADVSGKKIHRRKCDFDMEVCIDVHKDIDKGLESYIFFTGDGDFEPLYKLLTEKRKQVIVVYMHGHLGREIYSLRGKGFYKVSIEKLEEEYKRMLTKKCPPAKRGA